MNLERASKMSRMHDQEEEELGLSREERLARRAERRRRRQARKNRRLARRQGRRDARLDRKAEKLQRKQEKIEEKRGRMRERLQRRGGGRDEEAEAPSPTRRRPMANEGADRRAPGPRVPHGQRRMSEMPDYPDVYDRRFPEGYAPEGYMPDGYPEDFYPDDGPPMDPWEAELQPLNEVYEEDLGWSFPRWRRAQGRHHPVQQPRVVEARQNPAPRVVSAQAPRPQLPAPRPQLPAPWSPPARMGKNLRIQASNGHRAAIIELKPGLFVVADVAEALTKPELGFGPLLAPLMMRAASRSMARREAQQPQIVLVQVPGQQLALPGPVEVQEASPRIAAWADAEDLAGVLAEQNPRR